LILVGLHAQRLANRHSEGQTNFWQANFLDEVGNHKTLEAHEKRLAEILVAKHSSFIFYHLSAFSRHIGRAYPAARHSMRDSR
jgi:hypothetical protein